MLDGVSLDQLRTFVAAADEGSFSAAARRLRRTQSAVSETMANLEAQLGVTLFDRSSRYPRLTTEGVVLLADARSVVGGVDGMKARAKGMSSGLEAELTAVIDVFFPITVVANVGASLESSFPLPLCASMWRRWAGPCSRSWMGVQASGSLDPCRRCPPAWRRSVSPA